MVFPGQGSQEIGMGKEIYDNFPVAREVFEEVDENLGYALSKMMFAGEVSELIKTEHTQPAIMTVSMAILRSFLRVIKKDITEIVDIVAGHSLGEFSALCGIDFFSLSTCAELLQKRAIFMNEAMQGKSEKYGMIAVLGLDFAKIEEVVEEISKKVGCFCAIANDNCPGQVILSCDQKAIDFLQKNYRKYGIKRIIPLKVNIPFHCSLLDSSKEKMSLELNKILLQSSHLQLPMFLNAHPDNSTDDKNMVMTNLARQTNSTVRFREMIENATRDGVTTFLEVGHGQVLSNLIKKIIPNVKVFSLNSVQKIHEFAEEIMFI